MILRLLGVFSLVLFLFGSCMKKFECNYDACAYAAPAPEIQALQDYITNQGIVATQHCSGVFYRIEAAGTGKSPDACSNIGFRYKGTLLNGTVFDEATSTVYYSLGYLIAGWKNVVPLLKEGGKIVMYIPPSLGYGSQAQDNIPANSYLMFEMNLDTVY
jgi:FKBP-type peptidyl-prolyl cis-trans isomerase FkpA